MNRISDASMFARVAGVVLLGGTFLVAPCFAAKPNASLPSVVVRFADLNLNSMAGAAALYQRIHRAVQSVCVLPEDDVSLEVRRLELQCQSEAESLAIGRVNSDALSTYYRQLTGRSNPVVAMSGTH